MRSLAKQTVLLTTGLVIITTAIITITFYHGSRDILLKQAMEELTTVSSQERLRIQAIISELQNDTLFLAGTPPIQGLIRAERNRGYDEVGKSTSAQWQQRLESIFSTLLHAKPHYLQARLIDARGHEQIRIERSDGKINTIRGQQLQDKSAEPYTNRTLKLDKGEIYLSEVTLNQEHGKVSIPHTPVIRSATPITDTAGQTTGFVIINMNFGTELSSIEQLYRTSHHTLYIANDQGHYLVHPDDSKRFGFQLGHRYRVHEEFPRLARYFMPDNQQHNTTLLPDNQTPNALVLAKLPFDAQNPQRYLALVLSRPYQDIVAEETALIRGYVWLGAGVILLSALLTYFYTRRVANPLKQITQAINAFRQHRSDWALPHKSQNEIGLLANAFEDMVGQVMDSETSMRELNKNLEHEVQLRTHDLNRHLQLLNTISHAQNEFILSNDRHTAFDIMLDGLLRLTHSEYGFIGEVLHDEKDKPYLKTYAITNIAWNDETLAFYQQNVPDGLEFRNLSTLFGHVLTTGKTLISNNPDQDPHRGGVPEGHPPLNAFVGIPIYHGSTMIGMAGIANRPQGYQQQTVDELKPYISTLSNLISAYQLQHTTEQALLQLHESDKRWQFALEGSQQGVWDWNVKEGTVFFSRQWKKMLGFEEHEISNSLEEWEKRVHPDDMPLVKQDLNDHFSGARPVYENEHRVLCKDGNYKWILDRGMVVERDTQDQPLRVIGTHTDITERKRIEQMKNEFISTVSHELRTPLTSIRGSLSLITGGAVGEVSEQASSLLTIAHKNSERLLLLINDILDIQKMESGEMAFDLKPISLEQFIDEAVASNEPFAHVREVSLTLNNTTPPDTKILADYERLLQVMNNLISNAAKFSPSTSKITIDVSLENDFVTIAVSDQGPGIPPEFQDKVFDKFTQSDASDTRQAGGTGLGLSIAKFIMEKHGGDITFETNPGKGTVFYLHLSVSKPEPMH